MNKKYLLSSVTAGIALLYANHGTAQCVSTQDCTALGYTETSCPNGNGVKCPFGNKWFCGSSDDTYTENECMELACDKLGFKYDCTGTGYAGGSGSKCNGKYAACNCAEGYGWKDGVCVEKVCIRWNQQFQSCTQKLCSTNPTDGSMYTAICSCNCFGKHYDVGLLTSNCGNINSLCHSYVCKECAEWGLPQSLLIKKGSGVKAGTFLIRSWWLFFR